MSLFIPEFHFVNPADKLKPEWAMKVISHGWYNSRRYGLLDNKNVWEIEEYASGDFNMRPFKKMYKSLKKKMKNENPDLRRPNQDFDEDLQFMPVAAIPVKINSATALIQKIPIEIKCTALDPLAAKKKEEDLTFLKNKEKLEADLQDFADQLQIGEVDLGETKHSAVPFSTSPYGLDLNDPEQLDVFINLFYSLGVEVSFETLLQTYYQIKKLDQIKLLEIGDHLKFGVSVHRAFESSITRMPDAEYRFPGEIEIPFSVLPDKSDRTHTFDHRRMSVLEMYNNFSNEIGNKEALELLISGEGGYCDSNNLDRVKWQNYDTFKVNLIYVEVKSVDWVGVGGNPKSKKGFSYLTSDPKQASDKIWGQNTYCFWWLPNTRTVFNIHRLPASHRQVGQEAYQGFTHNIYQSQKKGAVELCIPENKKIQIAAIKMMHALMMSLPAGKYIDLKYLRGALSGLKDEQNEWTMDDLINLAFEKNIFIGDTEGFDSKLDGQLKPFVEIPGGLKSEITGYLNTILSCEQNISKITGINDQVTGQGVNPEGLVGIQKLLINSSINSIYYVNEGIQSQFQGLMNTWAAIFQDVIAGGGKAKEGVIRLIGSKKTNIIKGLNELPLHTMGIVVSINQREEERLKYDMWLKKLSDQNVISAADMFMLEELSNPKDKWALLAIREKQFYARQLAEQQAKFEQNKALMQQQGQNQVAIKKEQTAGEKELVYAKGDVQANIIQLASSLGLQAAQVDGMIKNILQDKRNKSQLDKSISTLTVKNNLEQQEPLTA